MLKMAKAIVACMWLGGKVTPKFVCSHRSPSVITRIIYPQTTQVARLEFKVVTEFPL